MRDEGARVDGEPVMLARRGEEIFAVGLVSTHYGQEAH